ncbi:vacuolar ATP synthase subunit H [Tieghemostelium lacteum]|uniref:V-type proton ATPase subunit H n=1 Tax=Tieghemostelium lacteum TaxID=361077 RepID=A0A151Z8C1_TIELA|nr:vacuolar ATP synthase subunit H [Tieghemostelium lacteum]|eukprot:KYQ90178.1 vacuolar ATP synthase subunit H [Tieghemostelium lacteum]
MDTSNGVKAGESSFKEKVLAREIPWNAFASSNSVCVTAEEYDLISKYDKHPESEKKEKFNQHPTKYVQFFVNFTHTTTNAEIIQYLLTLINEVIQIEPKAASYFAKLTKDNDESYPYSVFLKLLGREDPYINLQASVILGSIMCAGEPKREDVEKLFNWISPLLRKSNSSEVEVGLIALQTILLRDDYRLIFKSLNGPEQLLSILQSANPNNIRLLYETLYTIWLLTFNEEIVAGYSGTGIVAKLVQLIKTLAKEKIVRLSISTLRNLMGKGTNNEEMIDNGVVRMLDILSNKRWDDQDIVEDIEAISKGLSSDIDKMSSFNKYKAEIISGDLEWTPVHKSERFWKENATKFEENNYQIIKYLQLILQKSSNATHLSIACHDLGEFVRFHSRGKVIIESLGIKPDIMTLMSNTNEEVKKQALFALQKMMITNWEYLSNGAPPTTAVSARN